MTGKVADGARRAQHQHAGVVRDQVQAGKTARAAASRFSGRAAGAGLTRILYPAPSYKPAGGRFAPDVDSRRGGRLLPSRPPAATPRRRPCPRQALEHRATRSEGPPILPTMPSTSAGRRHTMARMRSAPIGAAVSWPRRARQNDTREKTPGRLEVAADRGERGRSDRFLFLRIDGIIIPTHVVPSQPAATA